MEPRAFASSPPHAPVPAPAPAAQAEEDGKSVAGNGYTFPARYTHQTSVAIAELCFRLCVAALTLLSLCLVASDYGFTVVAPMNYLLASSILPFLYSVAQSVLSARGLMTSESLIPIGFYTIFSIVSDLVCAILLLSGSSAVFGATTSWNTTNNFISQANAAAAMAFLGFLFMLPLIFISMARDK